MPKPRTNWSINEKRGVVVGWFHELREPGQTWTPRLDLYTAEEYLFKTLSTGKKRRTESERKRFIDQLRAEKLKSLLADRKASPKKNEAGPKINEVFQEWLDHVSAARSKKTILSYAKTANLYVQLIGNHRMGDLSRALLARFMSKVKAHPADNRAGKLLSDDTVFKHGRQLQTFLIWAKKSGYTNEDFEVTKPRLTKKEYRTLPPGAAQRVQ